MHLVLISLVFLLHGPLSFAASIPRLATELPATSVTSNHPPVAAATRTKLQPGQDAVRTNAAHGTPAARQPVQPTATAKAADDTETLSYGTLLATLILMAAIAVRRSKAERP